MAFQSRVCMPQFQRLPRDPGVQLLCIALMHISEVLGNRPYLLDISRDLLVASHRPS